VGWASSPGPGRAGAAGAPSSRSNRTGQKRTATTGLAWPGRCITGLPHRPRAYTCAVCTSRPSTDDLKMPAGSTSSEPEAGAGHTGSGLSRRHHRHAWFVPHKVAAPAPTPAWRHWWQPAARAASAAHRRATRRGGGRRWAPARLQTAGATAPCRRLWPAPWRACSAWLRSTCPAPSPPPAAGTG
jgi:hypothetical protein